MYFSGLNFKATQIIAHGPFLFFQMMEMASFMLPLNTLPSLHFSPSSSRAIALVSKGQGQRFPKLHSSQLGNDYIYFFSGSHSSLTEFLEECETKNAFFCTALQYWCYQSMAHVWSFVEALPLSFDCYALEKSTCIKPPA